MPRCPRPFLPTKPSSQRKAGDTTARATGCASGASDAGATRSSCNSKIATCSRKTIPTTGGLASASTAAGPCCRRKKSARSWRLCATWATCFWCPKATRPWWRFVSTRPTRESRGLSRAKNTTGSAASISARRPLPVGATRATPLPCTARNTAGIATTSAAGVHSATRTLRVGATRATSLTSRASLCRKPSCSTRSPTWRLLSKTQRPRPKATRSRSDPTRTTFWTMAGRMRKQA